MLRFLVKLTQEKPRRENLFFRERFYSSSKFNNKLQQYLSQYFFLGMHGKHTVRFAITSIIYTSLKFVPIEGSTVHMCDLDFCAINASKDVLYGCCTLLEIRSPCLDLCAAIQIRTIQNLPQNLCKLNAVVQLPWNSCLLMVFFSWKMCDLIIFLP